jgi:hypothetical protein
MLTAGHTPKFQKTPVNYNNYPDFCGKTFYVKFWHIVTPHTIYVHGDQYTPILIINNSEPIYK